MARGLVERRDVELLVDKWARTASEEQGGVCSPMLEEFDFGFVAWVRPPAGVRPEPDSSACHVIDRVSGEIIPWGSIPPEMVADAYRRERPPQGPPPVTADPVAMIRRAATSGHAPTIAANLRLAHDRVVHTAYGAKGDQELNHHPLVRDWLAAIPAGHLVRGAERHAELVVISDALHAYEAGTGRPTTLEEARVLFAGLIEFRRVFVSPSSLGGEPAISCHTCLSSFVHFGLRDDYGTLVILPSADDVFFSFSGVDRADIPAEVLAAPIVRRLPDDDPGAPAGRTYSRAIPADPTEPQAQREMSRKYRWLTRTGSVPGQVHRVDMLHLFPNRLDRLNVVAPYAARLGAETLYVIGRVVSGESAIVGDERGRVFVLDQAGEWFLGHDIDEAVVTLLLGRSQPRVRDDGSW